MPRRLLSMVALVLLLAPAAASAQIRQVGQSSPSTTRSTLEFSIGYFGLKGIESREADDVLVGDLVNDHPLLFEVNDLNRATFNGQYLFAAARQIEVGVGLGFSQRTISTVYADLTHSNGDEIRQDLKLRMIPVNFTGRFLILPRGSSVVGPYIGGGITAIRYQYSEVGEFVDDFGTIFPAVYKTDGTAAGPIVLAGVRAPVENWTVGGEFAWQKVVANVPPDTGLLGTKLDLGGWNFNFTVGFRF